MYLTNQVSHQKKLKKNHFHKTEKTLTPSDAAPPIGSFHLQHAVQKIFCLSQNSSCASVHVIFIVFKCLHEYVNASLFKTVVQQLHVPVYIDVGSLQD